LFLLHILYRAGARVGFAGAMFRLGKLVYDEALDDLKRGWEPDFSASLAWFKRAAEKGHPWAQYRLGLAYDVGAGVAPDASQAAFWYLKAGNQGVVSALFDLVAMHEEGRVELDEAAKARMKYLESTVMGKAWAQQLIGERNPPGGPDGDGGTHELADERKTLRREGAYSIRCSHERAFLCWAGGGLDIGDHYGDPKCAVMDVAQGWCVTGGEGLEIRIFDKGFPLPGAPVEAFPFRTLELWRGTNRPPDGRPFWFVEKLWFVDSEQDEDGKQPRSPAGSRRAGRRDGRPL
jgi:hypothetical protein